MEKMKIQPKYFIWLLLLVLLVALGKNLIEWVSSLFGSSGGATDPGTAEQRDEIINQIENATNRSNASITSAQAAQKAERLFNAMNQWGTDSSEIFDTLKDMNPDDLRLIYAAFGSRPYSGVGAPGTAAKRMGIYEDILLGTWFKKELGWIDLKKVRTIFAAAGIEF